MPYNINKASNYYCLAAFNEDNNQWRCVSRQITDINENIIEFVFPFPAIYAVIFSPITYNIDDDTNCDFVC